MITTITHFNSRVRNCQNCTHRVADYVGERYDFCRRFTCSCSFAVFNPHLCAMSRSAWQPIPPRRSLRQWLYDLLWK